MRIEHCFVATHSSLRLVLTLLVVTVPLPSLAQTGLLLTEEQKIGMMVNQMAQRIQYCKPTTRGILLLEDVSVDGMMMTPEALRDTLVAIVSMVPTRGQGVHHPRPEAFGPFFDFDIVDQQFLINLPEGRVNCTYRTILTGEQSAPGLILFEKTESRWRITTIDGLLPFLRMEAAHASQIRQNEPPKREAMQLRKRK